MHCVRSSTLFTTTNMMQQLIKQMKISLLEMVGQNIDHLSITRLPQSTISRGFSSKSNSTIKSLKINSDTFNPTASKFKAKREKRMFSFGALKSFEIFDFARGACSPPMNYSTPCVQCSKNFSTCTVSQNYTIVHSSLMRENKILSLQKRNIWNLYKRLGFGNYHVLDDLGEVFAPSPIPSHIKCPPYAQTGQPIEGPQRPEVKEEWEIEAMRYSCRIARSILNTVGENIKAGMTTEDIDALAHSRIIESGSYPSPLNYQGFPKSVCTSVNNVACHGIPNNRKLVEGDIVSVDVTVFNNGHHGDCCETYLIGDVDEAGRSLVDAARKCRDKAIAICGPGVPFSSIGAEVERVAYSEKVTVVPCFIGHGIGRYFHGPPDIYHCYNEYDGTMEPGMTFTIEPVIAQGCEEVLILEDSWTAVMVDDGRAAQFEHTILITDNGHEILSEYY